MERRVDELARRVDRFAVARDAYEIFICMYIAARGFVRPHDAAPSPTPRTVNATRFNASPAFVQRLMQLSYVGTMYLMLMNASSPPYISMSCSVSRMSSPTHVFFRCP